MTIKYMEKTSPAEGEKERENKMLKHNLRDIVSNLAYEYNSKNDLYNDQQRLLNKYDYYISLVNKKLNGQLNSLEDIQNFVATRDALVRANQRALTYKDRRLHAIYASFIWFSILIFVLVGYLGNRLSLATFLTIIIMSLVIYFAYMAWYFNFLNIPGTLRHMGYDVKSEAKELAQELEDDTNKFINGNCDCPDDNHDHGGNGGPTPTPHTQQKTAPQQGNNSQGFVYYDNTAPKQTIYPPNSLDDTKITWFSGKDMGMRSTGRNMKQYRKNLWKFGTKPQDFSTPKGLLEKDNQYCPYSK